MSLWHPLFAIATQEPYFLGTLFLNWTHVALYYQFGVELTEYCPQAGNKHSSDMFRWCCSNWTLAEIASNYSIVWRICDHLPTMLQQRNVLTILDHHNWTDSASEKTIGAGVWLFQKFTPSPQLGSITFTHIRIGKSEDSITHPDVYPSKSCSQKACPLLIITPPQLPLKLTRHEAVGKVLHRNHSMHDAKWGTIPGGSRSWLQHCLYRGMPVGWPNPCWHMPGFCSK